MGYISNNIRGPDSLTGYSSSKTVVEGPKIVREVCLEDSLQPKLLTLAGADATWPPQLPERRCHRAEAVGHRGLHQRHLPRELVRGKWLRYGSEGFHSLGSQSTLQKK